MATMPLPSPSGQVDGRLAWFASDAGLALLASERPAILNALSERPAMPWLWLAPAVQAVDDSPAGRGLLLARAHGAWQGDVRCGLPLPLPGETIGCVAVQHVLGSREQSRRLLAECARVLAPGGRLWLLALNPLSPYRLRWRGSGLRAAEPLTWRRRLRAAGLAPEPISQGIGPSWQVQAVERLQDGPGLRAAYLIRAERRAFPVTPIRQRKPLHIPEGAHAT